MANSLQGKGFFTWRLPLCDGGNPAKMAFNAQAARLSHVLLKIADGPSVYRGEAKLATDMVPAAVEALRAAGIQVWGWHFVYGDQPDGEAMVAIQRIKQFNLDGYVVNAEGSYETQSKRGAARRFMEQVRSAVGSDLPIGLSSYRYPSVHSSFPWAEFLQDCDIAMPQVYWVQAHNPAVQLQKTVREYQNSSFFPTRTVIPTGAAYREGGWQPTVGEIQEFMLAVKQLNLSAMNFWEYSEVRMQRVPGAWDIIRDFAWDGQPVKQDICQDFVDALNSKNVDKILSLYTSTPVHVNAYRTIAGQDALRQWYTSLFTSMLPLSTFKMTGFAGTGDSRHFTWAATGVRHRVDNGNDTFGLINGKIAYHYTFFTVTPG